MVARRFLCGELQKRAVWLASATITIVLVCYPLGMLISGSFENDDGSFTLANYLNLVGRPIFRTAIVTSIELAVCSTVLSVAFGLPMAWAVARTNIPLKGWVRNLTYASFITPPYLGALAWILLLGPHAGKLNLWLRALMGLTAAPFNIFSFGGLVYLTFLASFPFVFITCVTALDSMDPAQEDAARILGATTWKTAVKVTIPLMGPAISSGAILAFIEAANLFGTAVMVGMPVGLQTVTTRIYLLFQYPPQYAQAAALCMPLILATAVLLLVQRLFFGSRQFVTIGGKASQPNLIQLGWTRYLLVALCLLVTSASVVLPYLVLATVSLTSSWGNPLSLSNLTFAQYKAIFTTTGIAWRALLNSLGLGAGAAILAMTIAACLATMAERTVFRGRGLVAIIAMIPFAVPGIALGVAMMWAYISPPLVLYGTVWILLVTYVTKWIPLGFTVSRLSLKQMSPEFEEASRNLGATWMASFRRVTLPLMKIGLIAGWLQVFIHAIGELPASSLLYSPNHEVLSVLVLILFDEGHFESVAALAVILLAIVLVLVIVARRFSGRLLFGSPS